MNEPKKAEPKKAEPKKAPKLSGAAIRKLRGLGHALRLLGVRIVGVNLVGEKRNTTVIKPKYVDVLG